MKKPGKNKNIVLSAIENRNKKSKDFQKIS